MNLIPATDDKAESPIREKRPEIPDRNSIKSLNLEELTNFFLRNRPVNYDIKQKTFYDRGYYDPNIDHLTGGQIFHVSPSQLPHGVKGMVYTTSGTTYLANDQSSIVSIFVRYHEEAHRHGIHDEAKADAYASARAGYNLRPFGESNLLN
jgi:hypothetical protein